MTAPSPITAEDYAAYRVADALDRRLAASLAAVKSAAGTPNWAARADLVYAWLRDRPTVAVHGLVILPGVPTMIGDSMTTPPVPLVLIDQQEDVLTVSAVDALGQPTPDTGPFTAVTGSGGSAVASVVNNNDGTFTLTAVAIGSDTVTVSDANGITSPPFAFSVNPGPASSLVITPGTPTDIPSPAGGGPA